jgi:hypothetical protein
MSLGLIKPGMSAIYPPKHSKAGQAVEPIGYIRGKAVWPGLGGAPDPEPQDDPDADPDEDEDDEDDEDEDEDPKSKKKSSKKAKQDDDDDDDEEDEEDDKKPTRPERQAARYRVRAREALKRAEAAEDRLKALENKNKKPEEIQSAELTEIKQKHDKLAATNNELVAQLAFFRTPVGVEWADAADAFALAEREGIFEDVIDEDGTVDARELRRALKDLAKRKPHLVKSEVKSTRSRSDKDDDEDTEKEPSSTRSTMNGKRKGSPKTPDRAALAAQFPVLNRF